ncbi:transposase [Massilia sp. TS11]|uniref:REP-associated tyrosine transposase n=1 Tax=Massilia sp. TS11 TaxID=2908003 RepID=UPI001EDB5455|nr:transposase [Massilia sp. TS11]MCG2583732.1 transposase [Massilia sp. TS11]
MSYYRRVWQPGAHYFFTVVTERRQPALASLAVRRALRCAIEAVRRGRPFDITAWVMMPDHIHTIWKLPEDDADFATRWRLIKSQVTLSCGEDWYRAQWQSPGRKRKRCGTLWQARYWEHLIRDEDDLGRHIDYIHWNPVKHGLVSQVRDWPWSSFHRYVRHGIYAPDWGTGDGGALGFAKRVDIGD